MKYYRIAGQFDLDYNASRVELLGEFDVVAATDTQIALRKIEEEFPTEMQRNSWTLQMYYYWLQQEDK